MADKLTPQQEQAVADRGGKLLVSAAAGSGKTKVLVDRILRYITDPVNPANIDDFLIITYTKAAAAELRGKIAAKLTEQISIYPNNRHLRQQMQRLYLTKISTVHAFCADLLRDYAYRLDIPGDFRVAEENESHELQMNVVEQLLEKAYEEAQTNPDFCSFVDNQGFGRNDRQVPELILQLYNSAKCHLNPESWLDWCLQACDVSSVEDVSETVWGRYLIDDLHAYLDLQIDALRKCVNRVQNAEGMEKPVALLQDLIAQLSVLQKKTKWDDIVSNMSVDFGRLSFPRKNIDIELAEHVKTIREACKKGLQKKFRKFADTSPQLLMDMHSAFSSARGLVALTLEFMSNYDKCKQRKRVLDFSDLEHKTLDLLLGRKRTGTTAIAGEIGERYREVMVDEYQDSNGVQDAIFSAITERRQNCFMVGDVKQSIYQFRLADPCIFLEKYNSYVHAGEAMPGQGRRVLLSSNFRSSRGVIDAVNDVFSLCMSERVGGLVYGDDESLKEGVPHVSLDEPEVELYGICVQEATYVEESAFVAERIAQLLDGTHMVRQGETLRPISPEDIVILLRSPGSMGKYFVDALAQRGIQCCTGNSMDLLQTEEIETLRAILQIVDNPLQDIPLLAVLTSKVFGFTANDLAVLRANHRGVCLYDALCNDSSAKAQNFLRILNELRVEARTNTLAGLLGNVFSLTKLDSIFSSLKDGEARERNLMSFYKIATDFDSSGSKSLRGFLRHLEALEERGLSTGGESTPSHAVTIMSIHKSKGLEFPVVFLCGLSRGFNQESVYAQILCDKDLGIGLSCIDAAKRIRYPSMAKRAIATKMLSESLSEEMRVLYVAMTRAKDRLIMTYASNHLDKELSELSLRMEHSNPILLTGEVDCPGQWVLMSALKRIEAGAFFAISHSPSYTKTSDKEWKISVVQSPISVNTQFVEGTTTASEIPEHVLRDMERTLKFRYSHLAATKTPAKQTATQLKGREKDQEIAEDTRKATRKQKALRTPRFDTNLTSGTEQGNAMHAAMQYIRYEECAHITGVQNELKRLVSVGQISGDQAQMIDAKKIARFFETEIGLKLIRGCDHLREFKFSILDDAYHYDSAVEDEQILLQGVVDCALIECDGITVVDFKTDRITEETLEETVAQYRPQVTAYARALGRIYQKPIKAAKLYFFALDRFVSV